MDCRNKIHYSDTEDDEAQKKCSDETNRQSISCSLSKNNQSTFVSGIKRAVDKIMERQRTDARGESIIVDLEALVPQDHLLRKIEKVLD